VIQEVSIIVARKLRSTEALGGRVRHSVACTTVHFQFNMHELAR